MECGNSKTDNVHHFLINTFENKDLKIELNRGSMVQQREKVLKNTEHSRDEW